MRRTCGFYHQPPDMYQAPVGNMFSPVGRDKGRIVDEWGSASNFVTNEWGSASNFVSDEWGNASNFVTNEWGSASNFVSPSSRGRRSDSSDGRSYSLLQQSKERDSEKIKKLEKELKLMREDKEALQRRVDQLEKLLKIEKDELLSTVAEDNMHRVAKDFEVQFDKTWKESYETQIKNLKAELQSLYNEENPVTAMEKTPRVKKRSPIAKKKLTNALKKFESVRKRVSAPKKTPIAKRKLANALRKLISVEKKEPEQAVIKCNTCDLIFKTAGLLRRHMRCEHSSVITSNQ